MVYKLKLRDDANEDIISGYKWYEEKSVGLGNRFIDEVEEMLDYIQRYPEHYQVKYSNYREGVFKIFPYVITYEIIDDLVLVFAVFPTRDDPNKKPK